VPCGALIGTAQGLIPEYMYLVTPGSGFEHERYRTGAFAAYLAVLFRC
jgi:hypothetical protein